jgi:hypothetical protein
MIFVIHVIALIFFIRGIKKITKIIVQTVSTPTHVPFFEKKIAPINKIHLPL